MKSIQRAACLPLLSSQWLSHHSKTNRLLDFRNNWIQVTPEADIQKSFLWFTFAVTLKLASTVGNFSCSLPWSFLSIWCSCVVPVFEAVPNLPGSPSFPCYCFSLPSVCYIWFYLTLRGGRSVVYYFLILIPVVLWVVIVLCVFIFKKELQKTWT